MSAHGSLPHVHSNDAASPETKSSIDAYMRSWSRNMTRLLHAFNSVSHALLKGKAALRGNAAGEHVDPEDIGISDASVLKELRRRPQRGVYAPACVMHNRFRFDRPLVSSLGYLDAFVLWYDRIAESESLPSNPSWIEPCAGLDCNPTCIKS